MRRYHSSIIKALQKNHHIFFLYSTFVHDLRGTCRFRMALEGHQTKCQVALQTKTPFLSVLLSIRTARHSWTVTSIYSAPWNVLWEHFDAYPFSLRHTLPLAATLTPPSPSVKHASGSSDSSGSSSTESTPSPGGRISTVLPSDELGGRGSMSIFWKKTRVWS